MRTPVSGQEVQYWRQVCTRRRAQHKLNHGLRWTAENPSAAISETCSVSFRVLPRSTEQSEAPTKATDQQTDRHVHPHLHPVRRRLRLLPVRLAHRALLLLRGRRPPAPRPPPPRAAAGPRGVREPRRRAARAPAPRLPAAPRRLLRPSVSEARQEENTLKTRRFHSLKTAEASRSCPPRLYSI